MSRETLQLETKYSSPEEDPELWLPYVRFDILALNMGDILIHAFQLVRRGSWTTTDVTFTGNKVGISVQND